MALELGCKGSQHSAQVLMLLVWVSLGRKDRAVALGSPTVKETPGVA